MAAVLLLSGCFHYVPGSYDPPPTANSEVRIRLATPRDVPMGEFTLNNVTTIEGVVAEASADTIGLWARWLYPSFGRKYDAMGATFYVPRQEIGALDHWRFSGSRTLLAAAVVVGLSTAVILGVRHTVADNPLPPPGGDNASVVGPR